MPFTEPTVRASVLSALPQYLRARGVDIKTLLREVNLDAATIDRPDHPISLNAAGRLFDLAARHLGDPAFGLSYAVSYPPGATGLLGQLMLSAPTVRDVFLVTSRYLQIHTTPVQPHFDLCDGGIGRFAFSWPASFTEPQLHYTAFGMASLILRLRRATGPSWQPLAADFQHREPDDLAPYYKFFGKRLKFDQRENGISVDATTLAKPMPEILPALHANITRLGEQELLASDAPDHTSHDTTSRLQTLLVARLANELPFELDNVAGALGVPSRALQWKLEQEATTYEKVLLLTRIIAAEQYLRDSDHQLTKIAHLLGFSELSAFSRWCGNRFNMTPSAYRRYLRGGGHPVASPGDNATRS